jgi:hypothetical protein
MISLQSIYGWLAVNHDAIEVMVWIVGLLALFFAGGQLSESRKQRGLTESFSLSEKINNQMSSWRKSAEADPIIPEEFGRALAEVLTTFEIISDGINRGYLSRMSREILTHQILDNLKNIYSHSSAHKTHKFLCDTPSVCSAFRIFILNHHKLLRLKDEKFVAFDTIFSVEDRSLIGRGPISFLERRLRVIRLNLHSAI